VNQYIGVYRSPHREQPTLSNCESDEAAGEEVNADLNPDVPARRAQSIQTALRPKLISEIWRLLLWLSSFCPVWLRFVLIAPREWSNADLSLWVMRSTLYPHHR